MPPIIDPNKCSKCGTCADICPLQVYGYVKKAVLPEVRYPEECWHCNVCVLDCPKQAISLRVPLQQMLLYVDSPILSKGVKNDSH